jgi:cytochrome b involved in lipid metabolism
MLKEFLIGIAVLFFGFGVFVFTNMPKDIGPSSYQQTIVSPTETPTISITSPITKTSVPKTPTPTTSANKGITTSDLAKHTNESSCWMVINGNVYDVTQYITSHPGGNLILLGCGKDATSLFNGTASMGKRHSSRAQSILAQLLVGPLVK